VLVTVETVFFNYGQFGKNHVTLLSFAHICKKRYLFSFLHPATQIRPQLHDQIQTVGAKSRSFSKIGLTMDCQFWEVGGWELNQKSLFCKENGRNCNKVRTFSSSAWLKWF